MSVAHLLYYFKTQMSVVRLVRGSSFLYCRLCNPTQFFPRMGRWSVMGRRWWLIWPTMVYQGIPWYTSRVEGLQAPPGLQASFMKSGPRVVQTGLSAVGCLEINIKFANPLASASSWQFIMVDKRHFDKDSISMSSVPWCKDGGIWMRPFGYLVSCIMSAFKAHNWAYWALVLGSTGWYWVVWELVLVSPG